MDDDEEQHVSRLITGAVIVMLGHLGTLSQEQCGLQ